MTLYARAMAILPLGQEIVAPNGCAPGRADYSPGRHEGQAARIDCVGAPA